MVLRFAAPPARWCWQLASACRLSGLAGRRVSLACRSRGSGGNPKAVAVEVAERAYRPAAAGDDAGPG
jgi:hypothetical protein